MIRTDYLDLFRFLARSRVHRWRFILRSIGHTICLVGAATLAAATLIACLSLASCAPRPAGQPGASPSAITRLWQAARPIARQIVDSVISSLIDGIFGPRASSALHPARYASVAVGSDGAAGGLVLVRRSDHPPWGGVTAPQRVRLGVGAAGHVGAAYVAKGGAATVEDAAGRLVWSRALAGRDLAHQRLLWAGGVPLVRDGTTLVVGTQVVASGAYEAYAGTEAIQVAWQPCAVPPCPAALVHDGTVDAWPREIFGVDVLALSGPASGTVAVATREHPNASGWTLRVCPGGTGAAVVGCLQTATPETWRPAQGMSLEDPTLVRGASRAMLVGTMYDLAHGPTGQVWAAEHGGTLHKIGQVGATPGNAEISACELGGVLWVAAEVGAGSGLWRYDGTALQLVGTIEGQAPSCASAEGSIWISSSAGLWRLAP